MVREYRRNIVATRLTDKELEALDLIIEEEGITDRASILYKIIFDFLKSKRLEKQGQRIVLEHKGQPPNES
jgi:metal-responsive CopG/Arc/MetJ family transcriptional regulator